MLDDEFDTFMMHVATLNALSRLAGMTIYPLQAAQITTLKEDEAFIKVSCKYTDNTNLFSLNVGNKIAGKHKY